MGILLGIKNAANATVNMAKKIAKPVVSFVAGPVITYGALGMAEVAARVEIYGLRLSALNAAVSSLISTGLMEGMKNTEIFSTANKESPQNPDETSSLIPPEEPSQALITVVQVEERELNKKGKLSVYLLANMLGTGAGILVDIIMSSQNFPNGLENLDENQKALVKHVNVTGAASLVSLGAQVGLTHLAAKLRFFTQPTVDYASLGSIPAAHVQGAGYQAIPSAEIQDIEAATNNTNINNGM